MRCSQPPGLVGSPLKTEALTFHTLILTSLGVHYVLVSAKNSMQNCLSRFPRNMAIRMTRGQQWALQSLPSATIGADNYCIEDLL
jgi:hypothetical protein